MHAHALVCARCRPDIQREQYRLCLYSTQVNGWFPQYALGKLLFLPLLVSLLTLALNQACEMLSLRTYKQVGMRQLPGLSLCLDRRSKVFVESGGTFKVCRVHIPNEFIKWITASSSPLMELIVSDWWFADAISYLRPPHFTRALWTYPCREWMEEAEQHKCGGFIDGKVMEPEICVATQFFVCFFWTLGWPAGSMSPR